MSLTTSTSGPRTRGRATTNDRSGTRGGNLDDHGTSLSISRRVRASAGLPSGRAMVGALLVSASALGVIAAYQQATAPQGTDVVVINAAVEPGATIEARHLAYASMDLVDVTEARAFRDPDDVIGSTALVALAPGDLLSPAMVADGPTSASLSRRSLSLALDATEALGGNVAAGNRVDIVALPGRERDARVLVRDAIIGSVGESTSAAIGSAGMINVVIDVPNETDVLAVVDAHSADGITLVRAGTAPEPAPTTTAVEGAQ